MSLKMRLARAGSKKRPFYRIVIADSRMPRDGRFIERIGTFNPLLAKDDENRVTLDVEKAKEWIAKGAKPTDKVARFLDALDLWKRAPRNNPQKAEPGQKARERVAEREEKEQAKKAAAEEAKNAPKEEAPKQEAPAEEAAAEQAPAEAAAGEAPAE